MIVSEPVPVHRTGVLTRGNYLISDDIIPHFRKVTDAVKDAGAVILQQLYHIGAHGDSRPEFRPPLVPLRPAVLSRFSDGSHAMTEAEIEELLDAHATAALRSKKAGFQGVEVWAAYHSLLDQFWTPWSNKRTDRWGGSLENRTRFSRTLIDRIRKTCGEDFIVGLAISYSTAYSVTLSAENLCEIVALHDATGHVDYVTCRLWLLPRFRRHHPRLHPWRKADHAPDNAAEIHC